MSTKQTEALKLALDWYDSGNENPDDFANMIKQVIALAQQPAQGCDYCNHPQYVGTKCKNCGREQPAQQWNAGVPSLYPEPEPGVSIKGTYEQPAQEPVFIKHEVENTYDWSEWVCPDPKSYLMKCCDCGLVHEAQFGVVRYKSETEREDCDMVDDPNLQAVFRMRRSEQWLPEDTAHRAGGLPMEQPEQRKPLTDEEIVQIELGLRQYNNRDTYDLSLKDFARAIEAAHGITSGEATLGEKK